MDYSNCKLCPRRCGVNRTAGEFGWCGGGASARVAKVMLHQWEEPALSPNGKSGAIFFGGCTLGCIYCQNRAISACCTGQETDSAQLRRIMEELIEQGAENIDLVTPTHFLPTILPALTPKLPVPVVYNCGGYERAQTIRELEGLVDIYLPDLKYSDPALARQLSGAENYFPVAKTAIKEMVRQTGEPVWEGERLLRGTVIRHLILPGQVENSLRILDWIGNTFRPGQVLVSLMRQYTPMEATKNLPPFDRRVTDEEYEAVLSWMYLNSLQGFVQEDQAADAKFIPDF
ncbi:MAG: 4Fe-4S cluster-binding domain-containing protein [Oscillospiraceae bacterium]|nr:4Fe-4S cluster-binding domain-containing protein [Oscillospiraceae bacterium]MBR2889934.1 4Fe-4S cluster-binding domain-containing protein [Oscillospiraceae bacterium]